ncbi:rRNA maturation RNase YbeY [Paenibacillus selenitireducens]|uniref:Endoribonuclease YbeY n=1 Tax=Paenibacillus selenitireducens TaxID=1324314 RepID=A0A1T2XFM3_9BACL|nr:rRNA maturation RNase YbeY [Paenibacillus selenitireducens]OPA78413.1 rRNA maturation RNase YbeY [Paenibacillus selenitireducens]
MSVHLEWNNEQEQMEISEQLIERLNQLLQLTAEMEGITDGEVELTFVDDEQIHELNRDYRGIDRPTDVLSFAMHEELDEELDIIYEVESEDDAPPFHDTFGDIIISVTRAKEQSEDYGHSLERELGFLFVHGFLHLLGYDHQDEPSEKEMMSKQESVLAQAGLTR